MRRQGIRMVLEPTLLADGWLRLVSMMAVTFSASVPSNSDWTHI
jgi:hypothetical protein